MIAPSRPRDVKKLQEKDSQDNEHFERLLVSAEQQCRSANQDEDCDKHALLVA
jgi:hypothetical protein